MALEKVNADAFYTETSPPHFSSTTDDDERLAQLGHVQELRREFSIISLGGLCLCLMATWEALSTVVALALLAGGAPCLFYNYVLSFIATISIAASMGEIASIYPTAGGRQFTRCNGSAAIMLIIASRSIPLGRCALTSRLPFRRCMVHGLDLERRTDRTHSISSVCRGTSSSVAHHTQ